ncbi:MAG: glycosyltransferase [Planctomycetota bacterium]
MVRTRPALSVLLPIRPARLDSAHFREAAESIRQQTFADFEIIVILDGTSDDAISRVTDVFGGDHRLRFVDEPRSNISVGLNRGLETALAPLCARMDADDVSEPHRFETQVAFMRQHPEIAVLGSAFARIDEAGAKLETVRPPTDPREMQWKLLLGNQIAHGSVVMRRDEVIAAGGYDESQDRAQDYDLWLRMAGSVAAVNEVLYRYRARTTDRHPRRTHDQALVAARSMRQAWARLSADTTENETAERILAELLATGRCDLGRLEAAMTERPNATELIALLFARAEASSVRAAPESAFARARRALIRERTERLGEMGCGGIWLWGAGRHTEALLANPEDFAVPVLGVVDDFTAGSRVGVFDVVHPGVLAAGDDVLLSSDWAEGVLWEASAAARARGVRVHRLYADSEDEAAITVARRFPARVRRVV